MEFTDVIRTRRSVRKYSAGKIDKEVLARILDAVRIAPSGSNRQPWKFIVITDQAVKDRLVAPCNNQKFIAEAPVLIAACSLKTTSNRGGYMGEFSAHLDVSIAVDHLTLAARNEGLGTCWIGAFDNRAVKEVLGIPDDAQVVALTPLGYPEDADAFKAVSQRKALDEIVCYEKWA